MAQKKTAPLFPPPAADAPPGPPGAEARPPKRGKHLLSGMVEPAAFRQFGVLSAELGVAKQDLLREALNDLFRKHGKPPIA